MEFILFSNIILLLLFYTKFITRKGNSNTKLELCQTSMGDWDRKGFMCDQATYNQEKQYLLIKPDTFLLPVDVANTLWSLNSCVNKFFNIVIQSLGFFRIKNLHTMEAILIKPCNHVHSTRL